MTEAKPQPKYLKDYRPSDYLIDEADLRFELDETATRVLAKLALRRNGAAGAGLPPLVLDGRELELLSLKLDGELLDATAYRLDDKSLTLDAPGEAFTLEIETRINPRDNTSLEGLYLSGGNFCTQCEAEGFRKITYFLDRPDVMARYSTTIVADAGKYPVLLGNGNRTGGGEEADGRHWARWEDPYPKPSYLFALVAGKLVANEDRFTTQSGRDVRLYLWVRERDLDRTDHAMHSLKKAMRWDEETYGLEYDLDLFNIVAVDDFNMGAMENKSLNIFNSKYVLARPETATDSDFVNVEGVVAHEYFHNWTGNRVTLSSWFHLSLKEGLTVFRDQQFTAAMSSAAVERIQSVATLRSSQFPEDAGPMSHPVRPPSYIEMNNFYTTTVYEKGAEVIRMMHTLLGPENFRKGMDLYFERHDGQAVTTDDFAAAMQDASGVNLDQFRLWYDQAGTPTLKITREYDAGSQVFTLRVAQSIPDTPGQTNKRPMHIPLAMGLLDRKGKEMPLQLEGESVPAGGHRVLDVKQGEEVFRFVKVPEAPVPSLLRNFSAPVYLDTGLSHGELSFLMAHDSDSFNRWEAGQQLATDLLLGLVEDQRAGRALKPAPVLTEAFRQILADESLDPALAASAMVLPDERTLAERVQLIDPEAIHGARKFLRRSLGQELRDRFLAVYETKGDEGPYRIDPGAMGRRALRNVCLAYLAMLEDDAGRKLARRQFETANNMTDSFAALAFLSDQDCPERVAALGEFYERWRDDAIVLDKWFALQATCSLPGTLDEVQRLLDHESFDIKNPNKVRALLGAFAHLNPLRFNAADGRGYVFIADQVIRLNAINPQVAARLTAAFNRWRKFDVERQALMATELQRIVETPQLSPNVYEIASKALAQEKSLSQS